MKTTDKQKKLSGPEIAAEKQRAKIAELTGIDFQGGLGAQLAGAVADMLRTGLRKVDPDEEMPLLCSWEYHLARFNGPGANVAPLLYSISLRLGHSSGDFFPSMQNMARYLNVAEDEALYAAARLLVASGFWERIEAETGKPATYRPVPHDEWVLHHAGYCTRKWEFPHKEDASLTKLGALLHGVLGGEKFFPGVLKGLRKFGHTDDEIVDYAKHFLKEDAGQGSGAPRRVRFGQYLRDKAGAK